MIRNQTHPALTKEIQPVTAKLILSMLLVLGGASTANAQVLDAIRGHAQDLKARFSDHKKIDGEVVKRGEIDNKAKGQDMLHSSSGTWSLVRSATSYTCSREKTSDPVQAPITTSISAVVRRSKTIRNSTTSRSKLLV